jgi:very-short-patch-repair endonuclease
MTMCEKINAFIQKAKIVHGDKYDCSKVVYTNNKQKVIIICKEHGEFLQTPHKHLQNCGCRKCVMGLVSYGERKVADVLRNLNIQFEIQKHFDDCKYKRHLFFDFYLPSHNVCIEFDGEQHKKGWNGSELELYKITERDKVKTEYCKNKGMKLIRICETHNVEWVIKQKLKIG